MIGLLHGFAQALATGLLAAYLVLMGVNLISGIAPRLRRWSMPAARQSKLNALFQLRSSGVGPLSFLAAVLKSFAWQIGWPALAIPMYKMLAGRKTDAEFSARLALSPQDLRVAIFDLALMVVVLTLVALQLGWYPLELATVGLVLAATAARHLGYLIGPLLPMLRRSRLNPVTNFFGIAVADVSTLIVGIAALFDSIVPLHPSLNDLAKAALDLVSVNKLIPFDPVMWWATISQEPAPRVAVTFFSVLVWAVLIKSALTLKQFERTDEDIRSIATSFAVLGEALKAQTWLAKEHQPIASSLALRAIVSVALGQFDGARVYGTRARSAMNEDGSLDSVLMMMWADSLNVRLDAHSRLALMLKEIQWRAADATMTYQVSTCTALSLVPTTDLVASVMDALDERHYPIARSALLMATRDFAGAARLLEEARPGSEIEEAIRLTVLCKVNLVIVEDAKESAEMGALLDDWRSNQLPKVREISETLLQPWRAVAIEVLAGLNYVVRVVIEEYGYGSELGHDLEQLMSSLEDREGQASLAMRVFATLDQINSAAESVGDSHSDDATDSKPTLGLD